MPIGALPPYPTIQMVTNLVRSLVGDDMAGATDTLGEGQIFVDNTSLGVTMSNFFNSAMNTLSRKLRTQTGPMLIFDNYLLLGVPPLQSPTQGLASPDAAVQVSIGFNGYFNGTTMNSQFILPQNCLMVERLWERINGSNDDFRPLSQTAQGLWSVWQSVYNLYWEWRQDQVWMPGSIETMDFRLRYQGTLVPIYNQEINTATTYIPILDSQNALAGLMIRLLAIRQGPLVPQTALDWAMDETLDFNNEFTKRDQGIPYPVIPFGGENGQSGPTGLL